jgi:lysophospholipase L1-like esterase
MNCDTRHVGWCEGVTMRRRSWLAATMKRRNFKVRFWLGLAVVGVALALPAAAQAAPVKADTNAVDYYVSLGDSFSVGVQPIGQPPLFETDEGYADQLYGLLRAHDSKLKLVKLGCGGESTRSMRFGSVDPSEGFSCGPPDFYLHRYPHKTQLAEAVSFLHAHRSHVTLVTIDIGGNDVIGGGGVPQVQANLPVILSDLREAAGPGVPIVGMSYYDPFLAVVWFASFDLGALAAEADGLVAFNDVLRGDYRAAGDPVADVEGAFSSTDTSLEPDGVPRDVEQICQWTWMCSARDIHPNATGYGMIAHAFQQALP